MLTLLYVWAKYNKSSIATDLDPGVQTKAGSGSGANNFGGKKRFGCELFHKTRDGYTSKIPGP